MTVDGYVKWAKGVHVAVRKTGCDWKGKLLTSVERSRMQYL